MLNMSTHMKSVEKAMENQIHEDSYLEKNFFSLFFTAYNGCILDKGPKKDETDKTILFAYETYEMWKKNGRNSTNTSKTLLSWDPPYMGFK